MTEEHQLHTPQSAAARLSVGRSTVYELLRAGDLKAVHIGRSVRIPESELSAFVAKELANEEAW